MGLLKLKNTDGTYITVAQGPAGPIGPQGPAGDNAVTAIYQPTDGNDAPSTYPDGITYANMGTGSPGIPDGSPGTLVTVKHSGGRIYQEFVVASLDTANPVARYFRFGYYRPDPLLDDWGPWQRLDSQGAMELLQYVEQATAANATIEFTGIDANVYPFLEFRATWPSGINIQPTWRFNNISNAGTYYTRNFPYDGGTGTAGEGTNVFPSLGSDTGHGHLQVKIASAYGSSFFEIQKGYEIRGGGGHLKSPAVITSMQFSNSSNWPAGTKMWLYGIKE